MSSYDLWPFKIVLSSHSIFFSLHKPLNFGEGSLKITASGLALTVMLSRTSRKLLGHYQRCVLTGLQTKYVEFSRFSRP